mgnify:CR=1 FL=1
MCGVFTAVTEFGIQADRKNVFAWISNFSAQGSVKSVVLCMCGLPLFSLLRFLQCLYMLLYGSLNGAVGILDFFSFPGVGSPVNSFPGIPGNFGISPKTLLNH